MISAMRGHLLYKSTSKTPMKFAVDTSQCMMPDVFTDPLTIPQVPPSRQNLHL